MKINKNCTHCLKSFSIYPCNSKETKTPFCSSICYGFWQRGKSLKEQNKPARLTNTCSVEECRTRHFGKGFCKTHYSKFIESPKRAIGKPVFIVIPRKINNCILCTNQTKNKTYCSIKCSSSHQAKEYILKRGYKKVLIYDHPRADTKGYVFQHIVIMENHIGRRVIFPEEVHHIDSNKGNNNIENLMLFKDHKSHMAHHKSCIS